MHPEFCFLFWVSGTQGWLNPWRMGFVSSRHQGQALPGAGGKMGTLEKPQTCTVLVWDPWEKGEMKYRGQRGKQGGSVMGAPFQLTLGSLLTDTLGSHYWDPH